MDQPAIKVENVSKIFKLPREKTTSIKSAVINFYRRNKSFDLQSALSGVSFEVKQGEFFGIVGRNGSGKSTLLKLLAGIYSTTEGSVEVNGSLTPFIELGVGFNPELTGRENVFLNGALLGFNRKEMHAMYKDIVKFAELEKFMDQKLKNYSSGMQVRLAFSIAIRAKTDILLIDEVLAVGDAAFQQKCYDVFEKLKAQKKTIVFVSHDMGAIRRFCNRVILIDNGEVVKEGNPSDIARIYDSLNDQEVERETVKQNIKRNKNAVLQVEIAGGKTRYKYGQQLTVKLSWPKKVPAKNAGVAIYKQTGEYVFGTNTIVDKVKPAANTIEYSAKLALGPGTYNIVAALFGEEDGDVLEFVAEGPSFKVVASGSKWEGLLYLDHSWKV